MYHQYIWYTIHLYTRITIELWYSHMFSILHIGTIISVVYQIRGFCRFNYKEQEKVKKSDKYLF